MGCAQKRARRREVHVQGGRRTRAKIRKERMYGEGTRGG